MKELKITKDRVIKASESCPDAKTVLKELFPEAFVVDPGKFQIGDIIQVINVGDAEELRDCFGKIIVFDENNTNAQIGVGFKGADFDGHSLNGACKSDEGWWVEDKEIRLVYRNNE